MRWTIVERWHPDGSRQYSEVPRFETFATKEEAEKRMSEMEPLHGGTLLVVPEK